MFKDKQAFVNAFLGDPADPKTGVYATRRRRFIHQMREHGLVEIDINTVKRAYWMNAAIRFDEGKYYLIPKSSEPGYDGKSFEEIMRGIHDMIIKEFGDYKTVRFYKIKT